MENDQPQGVEERLAQFLETEEEDNGLLEESIPDDDPTPEDEAEPTEPKEDEYEELIHNGEVKRLTKDEVKNLAQQGFDYTQKTQQIAETRKQLEVQEQAIIKRAQFQEQFTDQIVKAKAIESQLSEYQAVDWTQWVNQIRQLSVDDPMQYQAEHARYQAARLQHDTLKENYQSHVNALTQMHQQAEQAYQQQMAQRLTSEAQAMKQAIPEWNDQTRAVAEMDDVRKFLSRNGFNDAEVGSVIDHRHVVVARKAMLYDKLTESGKTKVTSAPKVVKPGGQIKPSVAVNDKLRAELRRGGNGDIAAKLIEQML